MNQPLIVQWLKDGHTLAELEADYCVPARRHPLFPELVMLKYGKVGAPLDNPMIQECRGIILDESRGWGVVSYPFRKFFNHGEPGAADIDWSTARVYEKLDGSLMTLYWYGGAWRVSSSGMPGAGGPLCGNRSKTFADLFWRVWREMGYAFPGNIEYCVMFELLAPENRIVVRQNERRLVCIGARSLLDFSEIKCETAATAWGYQFPRSFSLTTVEECVSAAARIHAMNGEGFVVCDGQFNRVKIKSPEYVALAHMKDSFSPRRMLEVARTGESEEFLTYFPEMRPAYERIQASFEKLVRDVEADYARLSGIPEQKAFAMEALKSRCSSALFAVRNGKAASVRDFMAKATQRAVERAVYPDGLPEMELPVESVA